MCFLSLVVGLENRCDFFNKVGGVYGLWWKGEGDGKNWKMESLVDSIRIGRTS